MQGIPFYHFKCLCEDVDKIHQQSEMLRLPADHLAMITAQKEKLSKVYDEYDKNVQKIAIIIKEYKDQQIAIRRLMIQHKRYRKLVKTSKNSWKQETTPFTLKIAK